MRYLLGLWLAAVFIFCPMVVWAAPYFSVEGQSGLYPGDTFGYQVLLNSEGQILTSAQVVVSFDKNLLDAVAIDARTTACSFWAPADPSLGFGNNGTPYFYQDSMVVISCGFSNPGHASDSDGSKLLTFYLKTTPSATASGQIKTTNLTFASPILYYAGNSVTAGASSGITLTIFPTALQATPTPAPTSIPSAETIGLDDINFIEIGIVTPAPGLNLNPTLTTNTAVNAVSRDDTIPPPPDDLEKREAVAPLQLMPTPEIEDDEGEVLSVKSLRELLIPGKSDADKTVVLVNFITTLAFLIILAILVWRIVMINRKNKFKYSRMKEMITGELSVLEGKFGLEEDEEQQYREQLEQLKKELMST